MNEFMGIKVFRLRIFRRHGERLQNFDYCIKRPDFLSVTEQQGLRYPLGIHRRDEEEKINGTRLLHFQLSEIDIHRNFY